MNAPIRVAICADYCEEGWPSMDRVADRLLANLERHHTSSIRPVSVRPLFRRRVSRWSGRRSALSLDRALNRFVDYPRHVGRLTSRFDVFHVIDHSYAQLVHQLPPERTVVTCHDLDAFRSILQHGAERRSWAFRLATRHILAGLQRAACITCDTAAVRDELIATASVPPSRVIVAPIGADEMFSEMADRDADGAARRLVGAPDDAIEVLHVGSTVERKRIDVLLRACALIRQSDPRVQLVRVGGPFSHEQERLLENLGLTPHVSALPTVDDRTLAALYRRAAVVVVPSAREGFGLPVVEALRCGAPLVASDLPVLREVGGRACEYCPVGDAAGVARAVLRLLDERRDPARARARRDRGIAQVRGLTWTRFAAQLASIYASLHEAVEPAPARTSEACPA